MLTGKFIACFGILLSSWTLFVTKAASAEEPILRKYQCEIADAESPFKTIKIEDTYGYLQKEVNFEKEARSKKVNGMNKKKEKGQKQQYSAKLTLDGKKIVEGLKVNRMSTATSYETTESLCDREKLYFSISIFRDPSKNEDPEVVISTTECGIGPKFAVECKELK